MVKILRRLKKKTAGEQGFTLIEIIISAALLISALVPLIALMEMSAMAQRRSNLAITANNVANEEMEAIKGSAYDSVGLNIVGADPAGTLTPATNVNPPSAINTTFTVTRQISWYPSTSDKQAKKVIVIVNLPGQAKALASLTTYVGPTGVLPFNETPAETVTPSVSLIYPTYGVEINVATPEFMASASDPTPGRILMVKYFLRNLDATESVNYGYRLALYSDAIGYHYPSTLDAFNIIEPEPPLPDGNYAVFAQAIDINANSANSSERNILLKVPPTTPSNLTGILNMGDAVTSPTITLNWDASQKNDPITYKIKRRTKLTGEDWPLKSEYATVDGSETVFVDRDLKPNKWHRYVVRAVDLNIYGQSSADSIEFEVWVPNF